MKKLIVDRAANKRHVTSTRIILLIYTPLLIHVLLLNYTNWKNVILITLLLSILPLILYNFLNYSYWSIVIFIIIYLLTIGFFQFQTKKKL